MKIVFLIAFVFLASPVSAETNFLGLVPAQKQIKSSPPAARTATSPLTFDWVYYEWVKCEVGWNQFCVGEVLSPSGRVRNTNCGMLAQADGSVPRFPVAALANDGAR